MMPKGGCLVSGDGEGAEHAYGKLVEAIEFGALHDGIEHGLDHKARVRDRVIGEVHADKGLQEADEDHDKEREENERLAHHDLEHDEHSAKESVRVQVEQQAHPEHGRCKG